MSLVIQKQNPKRNHHVIPANYLKGFIERAGTKFIWVYTKGRKYSPGRGRQQHNPFHTSIRVAGMERDFYSDPKPDGSVDFESYENLLEGLEKPADPIFEKLRSRSRPTDLEKAVFSKYIIQMMKRTAEARKWIEERSVNSLAPYYDDPRLLAMVSGTSVEEKKEKLAVILERIKTDTNLGKTTHLRIFDYIGQAQSATVIEGMTWRFFIAPKEHAYLAGDNPVFIFKGMGLNKRASELSFPISSDIALFATHHTDLGSGFIAGTGQIVKECNRRTAANASKYLYASRNEEWTANLLNKGNHRCNLMR